MEKIYQPTWNSLRTHPIPRWFQDTKFGIYTHWGVYCVPGFGPNGSWYPYNMYVPGTRQHEHHVKTYGGPEKFGYKDFIPELTGEKFDADEWAEIFKGAGAQYAGPVSEHHDGFCMWDSAYTEWKATKMGPKRDVVVINAAAAMVCAGVADDIQSGIVTAEEVIDSDKASATLKLLSEITNG